MEGLGAVMKIIEKGHFCAEIDADDVQLSITMGAPLDTCEALLAQDEAELVQELQELCLMIKDYKEYLRRLHKEEFSYAV